jgi:hypothetical protein
MSGSALSASHIRLPDEASTAGFSFVSIARTSEKFQWTESRVQALCWHYGAFTLRGGP